MEASTSLPSKLFDVTMDSHVVSNVGEVNEMNDLSDHTIEEETNENFRKAHFVTDEVFDDEYPQDTQENIDPCNFNVSEVAHNNGGCEHKEGGGEPEDGPRTSRRIRSAPKRYQGANESNSSHRKRMRKTNLAESEDGIKKKISFLPDSMDTNLKRFSNPSPNSESSSLSSLADSPLRQSCGKNFAHSHFDEIDSKISHQSNDRMTLTSKGARKAYDFKSTTTNGVDAGNKHASETPFSEDLSNLLDSPLKLPKSICSLDELNRLEDTKAEIQKRLGSFEHIKESVFLCERRLNKESDGMECDCTLSKEDISRGRRGCGDDCLNRLLFIECGKTCSLGKRCSNKRFQNIENAPIEVFKTHHKGFGLRATRDIPRETFLMEYVGEVLDYRQFQKRARRYALDDAQHFYFMALSSDFFIDASVKGSISRFINHSCDPNAETQKWTVNGELRVGFFSKAFIHKGEEITFDYKYERYGQEAQKCFCGARACRGWLGGEPDKENRRPAGVDSDDEFSTETDEESESSVSKRQLPGPNKSMYNLSKLKKLQRHRPIKIRKTRKTFESREYEDVLNRLKISGIKTRAHTLELTRLMVRVTDFSPKITLASLLREADSPCRRLFLDYHGLKILHGWMSCLRSSSEELDLKLEIQDTLAAIPIPNKTMLVESKVWDTVSDWTEISSVQSSESSRAASPDSSSTHQIESSEKMPNHLEIKSPIDPVNNLAESEVPLNLVKKEDADSRESLKIETGSGELGSKLLDNEGKDQKIVTNNFSSAQDDITAPKPLDDCHNKAIIVREKALNLLTHWSSLQEVFKIPRRELVKLRVEHEREVERAAGNTNVPMAAQKYSGHYSYERRVTPNSSDKNRSSRSGSPTRTRISRLDDSTGLLQNDHLSREDRRVLFEQRAKLQQEEATRRAQLKDLHDYKCYLLKVDPAITAMFRGYPPIFYGLEQVPPIDPIEEEWDCPKMANLPCEAFREGDEQLVDPRFYSYGFTPTGDYRQGSHPDQQFSFDVTQIPLPGMEINCLSPHAKSIDDTYKQPIYQNVPQPLTNGYSTQLHPVEQDVDLENDFQSSSFNATINPDSHSLPSKKLRTELVIRLPKHWMTARHSSGKWFFFHQKTEEKSWVPPYIDEILEESAHTNFTDVSMIELETISTESESQGFDAEEDGVESDNEDDEDSDKEDDAERIAKEINSGQNVTSDLSAHEKEYLLRLSRKKTKEERRMDRKNKKIRDPEKWEEEQLKRKERHVKHLRDGLIQEWIIPRITDRDKLSLMSLKEQRERLANQKAIREQQNKEEMEEMERDRQIEYEKRLKHERDEVHSKPLEIESDGVRRLKNLFKKDASKVIVKLLLPYQRDDAIVGRIDSTEDFKHLAKKLTNYLLQKELRNCKRIEELKCSESVKKKSADFVRKYMSKFGEHYQRSPGP